VSFHSYIKHLMASLVLICYLSPQTVNLNLQYLAPTRNIDSTLVLSSINDAIAALFEYQRQLASEIQTNEGIYEPDERKLENNRLAYLELATDRYIDSRDPENDQSDFYIYNAAELISSGKSYIPNKKDFGVAADFILFLKSFEGKALLFARENGEKVPVLITSQSILGFIAEYLVLVSHGEGEVDPFELYERYHRDLLKELFPKSKTLKDFSEIFSYKDNVLLEAKNFHKKSMYHASDIDDYVDKFTELYDFFNKMKKIPVLTKEEKEFLQTFQVWDKIQLESGVRPQEIWEYVTDDWELSEVPVRILQYLISEMFYRYKEDKKIWDMTQEIILEKIEDFFLGKDLRKTIDSKDKSVQEDMSTVVLHVSSEIEDLLLRKDLKKTDSKDKSVQEDMSIAVLHVRGTSVSEIIQDVGRLEGNYIKGFERAYLKGLSFSKVKLGKFILDLRHSNLRETDFSKLDLGKFDFTGANMKGAVVSGATITREQISEQKINIEDWIFAPDNPLKITGGKPSYQLSKKGLIATSL